jgi:hypothetical protein
MDLDFDFGELNTFGLIMGVIAALITVVMFKLGGKSLSSVGLLWKILTPLVTFVVAYIYIDRTS